MSSITSMELDGIPNMTEDDILRLTSVIRPLPLPPHYTPVSGNPLCDIDDETLLTMPPHLICHIQRTAAQGGLQVISPRQVPFSALMVRTKKSERIVGDHIVGSTSVPSMMWPTIDGDDMESLLPDEPLPSPYVDIVERPKTHTEPLTKLSHECSDPVLECMLKGRAVIDVLRRSDVCGGADEMAHLIADAWGVDKEVIDELDAYTIGVEGPLLRHAIKTDDVYSTIHAPVHIRRCISVGAVEISRDSLPQDSALDWRRLRVHCEAVYCLSSMIEGVPIKYNMAIPPPGDPTAPGNRQGVLAFYPAPATAWTFEPSSFSLCPVLRHDRVKGRGIPPDVVKAISRHLELVRPMSYAMAQGHRAMARRSVIVEPQAPMGETISAVYGMVVKGLVVGSARGRTAAATLRNVIHGALEAAPDMVRLRLVRYMKIATEEVRIHLGLATVPDGMIVSLADKFLELGESVRAKVLAEAVRRGCTLDDWWGDITSQAPLRFKSFAEGTRGWAIIGLWLLFRSPTPKWAALGKAVHYSAMRGAAMRSVGALSLPPAEQSAERLIYAARGAVHSITKAYSGYYMGVADVGLAIADILANERKPRSADVIREAAYLWTLRARCFRGTNVNQLGREEATKSPNHLRVYTSPTDLVIAPAPYRAFEAYRHHLEGTTCLHKNAVGVILRHDGPRISEAFMELRSPLVACKSSLLTSYLITPHKLGEDLEEAWRMLKEDVVEVANVYGKKMASPPPTPRAPIVVERAHFVLPQPPTQLKDYYSTSAMLDEDTLEWVEDLMERGGEGIEALITERDYESADELKSYALSLVAEIGQSDAFSADLVK